LKVGFVMFSLRFHSAEWAQEFFSGLLDVLDITLVDVLDDHQPYPVMSAVDLRDDPDVLDALVQGLIGSVLEAPGVDLAIGQLRKDAYSGSDPDWALLPQWVFHADLPMVCGDASAATGVVWRTLNFQVRCRVQWMRELGSHGSEDGEVFVQVADGVDQDQNLLSYYSGDILSAYHFELLDEVVDDLDFQVGSGDLEGEYLEKRQALLQWFRTRALAVLRGSVTGKRGQ
jgi:hypothetical protein